MGSREMPAVEDFLTILPIEPDLTGLKGLPQCHRAKEFCKRKARWSIESTPYCTPHKEEIVQRWEGIIQNLTERPEQARDEDLELLELVRDEFPKHNDIYPHVAVDRVTKDLNLSETPEGRSLASWYLWNMGIFSIHHRSLTFEQS
ncbi:MAG: hypothetical protein BMS9Abin34_177 [Patescibacteria group bacterium]|nr:MAG: hypothetical protein BMS9Abin34_177 [Patescibacteria group bacterium]